MICCNEIVFYFVYILYMKEIKFYTYNYNLKLKAEDFINRLEDFVLLKKRQDEYVNGRFFINSTVKYKESSRRKGGYFSYTDIELKNCIVKILKNKAYIYTENYFLHNFSSPIIKVVNGKYFEMFAKEVSEKTYNKHFIKKEQSGVEFRQKFVTNL